MNVKAFIYHKKAERYSDCQDYFGIDTQNNRIAVSDGMSQSIFPQWWAKILVEYYLENGQIPKDILSLQNKWQQMLLTEIKRREEEALTSPKRDPWRLKNILAEKSGAGATLCGLTFGEDEWICECLGDSCVICINHDYTINLFTSQVGEFGNHPDYFDSFGEGRGKPIKKAINKKDVQAILMVTDPFAELFQLNENDIDFIKARFTELQNITTHESFIELVERWRTEFEMHNDDSTLILISDCTNTNLKIAYKDDLARLIEDENTLQSKTSSNCIESISNTNSESDKDLPEEIISLKEAVENLKKACKVLLTFYTGEKNSKKIANWFISHIKSLIDSYIKS